MQFLYTSAISVVENTSFAEAESTSNSKSLLSCECVKTKNKTPKKERLCIYIPVAFD
jgi:hypothetical protein